MASNKRTPFERENDLLKISELYLKGKTQFEIGASLGVSQSQISYDLRVLRSRWVAASVQNIDRIKAEQLAKLDKLEVSYWEAWNKSISPVQVVDKEGNVLTVDQSGDPRFLQGIERIIEQRRKVFGMDAPTKQDITSTGKLEIEYVNDWRNQGSAPAAENE
jgi:hypothetical protein